MQPPKIAILGGHYLKNLCLPENVWSCNLPLSIDPRADNSIKTLLREQCPFTPDLLLFADQGCLPMLYGFEDLEIPSAAYLIDTHLHYCWHRHFVSLFDQVCAAQQDAARSLAPCGWLPLFSRHGNLKDNVAKAHDIVFVGTVDPRRNPERVSFLDTFARSMPLTVLAGDYRLPFNSARIILNQSVRNDINFRVFEALATGSMLLTDDVGNGLDVLFESGRHLVTYTKGDVVDAINKAHYYLAHPAEREQIAAAGHAHVVAHHTLESRNRQFLDILSSIITRHGAPSASYGRKKLAAGRTWLAIALLMADLERLEKSGTYGQRIGWYLHLAGEALGHAAAMEAAGEAIIPDLALLAHLRGDLGKAATYTRIALLNTPDDAELLLLAARISTDRGDDSTAQRLYIEATRLIADIQLRSPDQLLTAYLHESLQFCRRYLTH